MGWQPVDERDEAGLTSGDETDDLCEEEETADEKPEERTSAVVVAEEGRALIVKGDGLPISQLSVQSGTTHLLIGSSSTPNSVPAFLTSVLPRICHTLLALDISANFLVALPPALAACESLEELNIASNPLRVLPVFLSHLVSLRVLIADATGIGTLPDSLCGLDRLHTLSVRRNRMHSLPSWLCLLPSLQELYLDGNPFQGPWQALVDPLLAKLPAPPHCPPTPASSTPVPPPSAGTETDTDESEAAGADIGTRFNEDETIMPFRAPPLGRSVTSPAIVPPVPQSSDRSLTRTRTAPNNRPYNAKTRPRVGTTGEGLGSANTAQPENDSKFPADRELRKMKSAGELRTSLERPREMARHPPIATPVRPAMSASASSSNLLSVSSAPPDSDRLVIPKRYASLGVSALTPARAAARPMLTQSLFDGTAEVSEGIRSSVVSPLASPPRSSTAYDIGYMTPSPMERQGSPRSAQPRENKERGGRWGFLKKMSMGKMRPDSPASSRPSTAYGRIVRPEGSNSPLPTSVTSPQIDVRFSTTGSLGPMLNSTPMVALSPPSVPEEEPVAPATLVPPSAGGDFLAPSPSPSPTPRAAKRRSFLPIDGSAVSSLTIPSPTSFVGGTMVVGDVEEASELSVTPSAATAPISSASEFSTRREEEKAKETYTRALRSVMAYLRDMNDLSLSQGTPPLSVYGTIGDELPSITRSRRPTVIDRTHSEPTNAISRAASISGQLRSPESIAALRSGTASQTVSVATTDSSASSEERKYKDDKGKRALIIREIVQTERTYVKGLQELVDIYIRPSAAPVNLISGVGSGKETIIPASERKIVFSGVEALFSFHKESFLPTLEAAAIPLMKKPQAGEDIDPDGQLSVEVTRSVAGIFLKHAAFMKMYSSYINNFDNSVQRIKHWSTDRLNPTTSPGSSISPTNAAHLAGLGLTPVSVPGSGSTVDPSATGGVPNLTSGQKKRIKGFLRKCRMNTRHSQLNLEGYLLLPVQRIPRYRLLLEELLRSTPPAYSFMDDALDRALGEISSLANNMNEGKRQSESRQKLVQWQARIRGKFPSPLVQPHRRLIMDGPLMLTRVVRKTVVSFETFNAQGDASAVQVECLAPELTPRPLVGILCNDLLVLCRDPSEGKDPVCAVDLWAVLRMQTLPQPASIVHGNALRIVDNKAILYFDAPSPSDALTWFRAINLHIPASKA